MSLLSTVLADSPLVCWTLAASSGTTETDQSGNSRTGTYSGTYTLEADTPFAGGVEFGSGGTLSRSVVHTTRDSYGLECVFKLAATTGEQIIASNGNVGSNGTGIIIRDGKIQLICHGVNYLDTGVSVAAGVWYHVLTGRVSNSSTGAANQHRTWINGSVYTPGTVRPNTPASNTQCAYNSAPTIALLAVYSSRLDDSRAEAHYAAYAAELAGGPAAIEGELSATLEDATLSATGSLSITGNLSATMAPATLSATGSLPISGGLSAALADATLEASGTVSDGEPDPITGELAVTLEDATLSATGSLAIAGELAVTLDDATLSAAGTLPIAGELAATLDDATLSAAGALPITGELIATLGDATLVASGTVGDDEPGPEPIVGELVATLEDATLVATGSLAITGQLSVQLDDATLVATGSLIIAGAMEALLDPATLAAAGTLPITGDLSATLADATLVATGGEPLPPPTYILPPLDLSRPSYADCRISAGGLASSTIHLT